MEELRCQQCKEVLVGRAKWNKQKYCSKACFGQYLSQHPETRIGLQGKEARKKAAVGIKKAWEVMDPAIKERMAAESSKRMKENNPSHSEKTVQKIKETKRINGTLHIWPGERGGNGKLSEPQKLLSVALGWGTELAIPLADRMPEGKKKEYTKSMGLPTCYKVDIGNQELKIGIEIDGAGHRSKENILKDQKKTKILRRRGWTILRFTNEEVMTDLSKVLLEIKKEIAAL